MSELLITASFSECFATAMYCKLNFMEFLSLITTNANMGEYDFFNWALAGLYYGKEARRFKW